MERTRAAVLLADGQLSAPETHTVGGGQAVVFTARSPLKSAEPNEDAAVLVPFGADGCVLAVADGMGGLPQGQLAARLALEVLEQSVTVARESGGSLRAAILDGFEQANRQILEKTPGSGTTLVVAAIRDGTVRPFHVGDSVALVTGQRGRIKIQTLAHSPVAYAVEAGVLSERDALHHDERHLVSNALGSEEMRIELGAPLRLAPRDTLLLASDGLFDNLTIAEIVKHARCGPLKDGVSRLAALARTRMENAGGATPSKADDLTIVAFRPKTILPEGSRAGSPIRSTDRPRTG